MIPEQAARRVRQFGERNPSALILAELLSFAAIAEPGLIRRMRLQLAPDCSASDEADVWFSPLVQSASPNGLVLFPEIAELLRKRLSPPLRTSAWELTRALHAGSRQAIQIEEELTYLSLDPETHRERIDELLHRVIGAFVRGRAELANWAGRALPRLPDAVRKMESAALLGVASDLHTGRAENLRQTLGALGRIPSWIAAVLPAVGRIRLRVGLANRVLALGPAMTGADAATDPAIEVPDTPIIPVEIRWTGPNAPSPAMLFLKKGDTARTDLLATGPIELVTLANESWTLSRTEAAEVRRTVSPVSLRALTDGTAVLLRWRAPQPIAGCIGFTLKRRRQTSATEEPASEPEIISPLVDVSGEVVRAGIEPAPIQRFSWIDVPRPRGALVSYQVVPLSGTFSTRQPIDNLASVWTPPLLVGPQQTDPVTVILNRTFDNSALLDLPAASVSNLSLAHFERAIAEPGNPIRTALGGDLLASLKALLEGVLSSAGSVYVAMFDLGDAEVLQLLTKLGSHANVILSDDRERKTAGRARNQAALNRSGVRLIERIPGSGRLAHNKFAVVCNSSGDPESVWTGNVTWSSAALCARSNVTALISSRELGQAYLSYWQRLASDAAIAELRSANGTPTEAIAVGTGTVRPFFTPVADRSDLRVVEELIRSARQGVLFLLSEPGKTSSLVKTIAAQPRLYKLGATRNGPSLTLIRNEQEIRVSGKALAFPIFDAARKGPPPRLPMGSTLQSRLIVIDPLGSRPVVLIGSHSFGETGSRENDENFVVIEGNPEVAQRCAAHIEMFCQHFRFRARAQQSKAQPLLRPDDSWQSRWFTDPATEEAAFWMGENSRETSPNVGPIGAASATASNITTPQPRRPPAKKRPKASKKQPGPARSPKRTSRTVRAVPATRTGPGHPKAVKPKKKVAKKKFAKKK